MEEGSSNLVKRETKSVYTMLFGDGYSTTTTIRIFLCFFLLTNVTMKQIADDIIYLRDPSGEFTSPEYPDTPPGLIAWNITVGEDHRILLQFLDFELVERNPCSHDDFELYDCAFTETLRRGRWCWDSFDKLNRTTYISRSNIFLLRLRTIQGQMFSRKGFKANYSSIPKEAITTAIVDITQTITTDKFTNASTTSTQNEKTTLDVLFNIASSTSVEETSPTSFVKSTQTANPLTAFTVSTSNINTGDTNVTETSNEKNEKYYLIAVAVGFLIICIFCLVVCCCLSNRKKNKTQDSSKSNDTEFQVLAPAGPVQSSQTSHEGSNFSVKSSNSPQNDFTENYNKKSPRPQSVGSAYSSPTYAIADKREREVFENDENMSRQSKVKESKGKSKVPLNLMYATPHGVKPDSTEFEINAAYQSCDSDKENDCDIEQVNNEYTYVENTDVTTDRPIAAPRVKAGEVTHSPSEAEEDGHERLVPNIAYQSFDSKDEQVEEQDDEKMTTNVAYQSCDSEEENVGKSDATYYYVDEEGTDKLEEQQDIVYESV